MGKVGFPLKLKFTAVILLLLLGTVGFYIAFAVDIFRKDKAADLYANSLSQAGNIAERLDSLLIENQRNLLTILSAMELRERDRFIRSFFLAQQGLYELSVFEKQSGEWKRSLRLSDKSYYQLYGVETQGLESLPQDFSFESVYLRFNDHAALLPGWVMGLSNKDKTIAVLTKLKRDSLAEVLSHSGSFKSEVIGLGGEVLLKLQNSVSQHEAIQDGLTDWLGQKLNQSVRRLEPKGGEAELAALVRVGNYPLFVLSRILESDAYRAARILQEKSALFGGLIFSIVVIVGVLFSRALTRNITLLTAATGRVAQGEFETKIGISSNDEIGHLAESFEFMGKEILKYIEQMKEKARLENEIKVAQLVQQTYFPSSYWEMDQVQTGYHFLPATECGGDWWGHFSHDGHFVFMICDATGHGVPAALLTATASSALSMVQTFCKNTPNFDLHPGQILNWLNTVVTEMEGSIYLTAFCGVLSTKTGELRYANASHHPAWLVKKEEAKAIKERITPLLLAVGPRIGDKSHVEYAEAKIHLSKGDELLLLTDGILEISDPDGKQYGQRRLIKAIESFESRPLFMRSKNIVNDALSFSQGKNDDDITLAFVRYGEKKAEDFNFHYDESLEKIQGLMNGETPFHLKVVTDRDGLEKRGDFVLFPSTKCEEYKGDWSRGIVFSGEENAFNVDLLCRNPISHLIGENGSSLQKELEFIYHMNVHQELDLMETLSEGTETEDLEIQRGDQVAEKIKDFLKNNKFKSEELKGFSLLL
jgi:sigma-B regulation protein RsbU (phosphoserine phosphatase)